MTLLLNNIQDLQYPIATYICKIQDAQDAAGILIYIIQQQLFYLVCNFTESLENLDRARPETFIFTKILTRLLSKISNPHESILFEMPEPLGF